MSPQSGKRVRVGGKIGPDLTVLSHIGGNNSDPVHLVWNHTSWCPMACKTFSSTRRARREALALSSLRHPNIVRCLGFLEPVYTLMEYLEGPTLGQFISRQPQTRLGVSDAVRVAIHIGSALSHMHASGFLHMDVKPDNIILVHGRPVLFDFGSIRKIGAKRPPLIAGTDPYIAPEECEKGHATEASDVFSLGVTLYEMLTGRLPFPDRGRSRSFPQVKVEPRALRKRRPAVQARLEDLVHGCLERDPSKRLTLPTLLPALNAMISTGSRMWPAGFEAWIERRAHSAGATRQWPTIAA